MMVNRIILVAAAGLAAAGCEKADRHAEADPAQANQAQANAAAEPAAAPSHKIVSVDQVGWTPAPPSLPAGAQAAVLHGDPTKEGMFVMRLKIPAGYSIAPHTHPQPEIVTVISGAFNVGMGETADKSKAQRLPAGSFFAFDPGMAHYADVDEETVVQISSTGPWGINYVNAADDPRAKQ